jgi:hypothetical protein
VIDLLADGAIVSEVMWLEGYVDGDVSPVSTVVPSDD